MSNFWQEQFDKYPEAEGVDFVSLLATPLNPGMIFGTYTKEMMIAGCSYPRSGYLFWKMVNGEKIYFDSKSEKREPGSIVHRPQQTELWSVRDYMEDKTVGVFEDRATAEEMCLTFYEEAVYFTALEEYGWHHHWNVKQAYDFARTYHLLDFQVEQLYLWKF